MPEFTDHLTIVNIFFCFLTFYAVLFRVLPVQLFFAKVNLTRLKTEPRQIIKFGYIRLLWRCVSVVP